MKIVFFGLGIAVLLSLSGAVAAQTSCSIQHPGPGVFICYPNSSENSSPKVPALFHLSAEINAPSGVSTRRYSIFLDNQLLYDNRLATPAERLPIELNLVSPFTSGSHTLRITAAEIGSTELKNLQFRPFENAGFCEPLSKVETFSSCYSAIKAPLRWKVEKYSDAPPSSLSRYSDYIAFYSRNLKSLEADVADKVALDSQGNLYIALHLFDGLELRKYTPNRSIVYDAVVQTCGPGRLSITGLAVDDTGHAWVAGNTHACLTGTNGAWKSRISDTSQPHAFVALLDTSKRTSTTPLYLTYLADAESQVFGIRVDKEGDAYVTGITSSPDFPHQSSFTISPGRGVSKENGFVAVLNPSGSALQWTALLQNAGPAALAVDRTGNVYITGRTGADAFLAELTERGTKLSNIVHLGTGDPRAIAVAPGGVWALVEAESELFASMLEPCAKEKILENPLPQDENSVATDVSSRLALDAFAHVFAPPSCPITQ
jgi:hypothetical protein